jgi:ankyrin repeat protein
MKELVTLTNSKLESIDLKDSTQYGLIKAYAKSIHVDEVIDFHEQIEALVKNSEGMSEEELKKVTSTLMNDFIFDKNPAVVALNLEGAGTDDAIVKARDKLRSYQDDIEKGNLTKEKCMDIIKTCKELDTNYTNFLLRKRGQIPNQTSRDIITNRNPIHEFIKREGIYVEKNQQSERNNVWNIIKKHADINQKNPEGVTPLQLAAMKGDKEMVARILDAGADPKITTTNYKRSGLTKFTDGVKGLFSGKGLKHFTENPPLNAGQLAKLNGQTDISKSLENAKPPVKKVEPPKEQVELLDKLGKIEKPESVVVDINELTSSKSAVVQISGASAKTPKVETSPMVANYMKEIVGILSELNVEHNGINPVDLPQGEDRSGYLRDLASKNELKVEIDALKDILVYLNANPTIDDSKPEEMAKLLEKASTVLGQAKIDKKIASKTSFDEEGKLSLKTQELLSTMKDQLSPKVPKSTAKMGQK